VEAKERPRQLWMQCMQGMHSYSPFRGSAREMRQYRTRAAISRELTILTKS